MRGAALGLLLLSACAPRPAPATTPAPAPASGVVVVEHGATPVPAQCTTTLSVGQVRTGASCSIDERVAGRSSLLVYPCGGGQATADFSGSVFQGVVDAQGQVRVFIETRFPYQDGCTWRSKQQITGPLAGPLAYEYREEPEPGQTGCAGACVASARVEAR